MSHPYRTLAKPRVGKSYNFRVTATPKRRSSVYDDPDGMANMITNVLTHEVGDIVFEAELETEPTPKYEAISELLGVGLDDVKECFNANDPYYMLITHYKNTTHGIEFKDRHLMFLFCKLLEAT
jgi:hypothetical protein